MGLRINKLLAKSISFGEKRNLKDIKYIVIHYTGNNGDTAKGNANYFATGNTRVAGAHFFVDQKGEVWKSVSIDRTAWSVGGFYTREDGAASYFNKCTNSNSVSIELCDCLTGSGWEQMKATRQLVKYIQDNCQNAKTIIRHWDVNGKQCPAPMTGIGNNKWKRFHTYLSEGYQFTGKVTRKAFIRSSRKISAKNKIGTIEKGGIVKIEKVVGNWGRLQERTSDGKYQWIYLKKVKEL